MTLAFEISGEGPPLLLVNGYASTGADWDPTFIELLAASHEVISPDNRGMGGSELGDAELTVGAMAADLEVLPRQGLRGSAPSQSGKGVDRSSTPPSQPSPPPQGPPSAAPRPTPAGG